MTALHDQAARDSVRDVHDVSLFVEAGAGTGKTTALVDRVVSLVASGHVDLRHLAAITFTEAAAAELRDRVRAALERVAAGDDDRFRDETARDRCTRALSQLDDAALSTLHGFAQRLLSEHPFEVGLPPGFRILDDVEASVDFDQRWAAFIDGLFDDTTLEPALMSWIAGDLSVERLRQVAHVFCEYHDRLTEPAPPEPFPALRIDELIRALDGLRELRERACGADDDPLARHIAELAPARDGLANAGDHLDQLQAVFTLPTLERKRAGRKPNWTDVDAARSACAAAEQLHLEVITEQRRAALTVLTGRLVSFARDYAALRRREGRLLFHDLLVLARDLLRNHPAAWAAASDRYRHLLVDEFQDTDPLQTELAVLLAAEAPHPGNLDWRDIAIRPGSLVLVGDPKQSIYRFRGADLRVYHQARERLGLLSVELVENFRSVPPILTVVNTVFAELLTEDPGVQAAHAPLVPHREGSAEQHRVVVLGADYDESMAHVREREADEVAAVAQQIVAEGWPVHDPDGAVRPAAAHDIALLIPSRTVLPALEGALERAGVPVRVESQSLVFSTSEIRDLLNILAAVDDPTDELAVVAALRASAFGCSDAELVGHATAGGTWDYRRDTQPEGRVNDALAILHGFWQDRWWRSVSGTVEAVVRERRLFELAAMHRRPRDHWRRIRFLLDQARAWEDAGGTSLRRFVEWATRQADEGVRVNEAVAPEPDDPALRILTVHGAKGLEFPIVILAGLNTLPANQPAPVLWGPHGPELRVGVGTSGTLVTTPGYDAERADEQRHELAERLRLLYVAMTRARDHLVVSLHHKTSSQCAARLLAPGLDRAAIARLAPAPPARPGPRSALPRRARPRTLASGGRHPGRRCSPARGWRRRSRRRRSPRPRRPNETRPPARSSPAHRGGGDGPGPRWAERCTPCSRASISKPARVSTPRRGPKRSPRAWPTARARSATWSPACSPPRWCARWSPRAGTAGESCPSPRRSAGSSSKASSTCSSGAPTGWWWSTTRPTWSPATRTSTPRCADTPSRVRRTPSRWRPRSASRSSAACSSSLACREPPSNRSQISGPRRPPFASAWRRSPADRVPAGGRGQTTRTPRASSPLRPGPISNSTAWPCWRVR